MIISPHKIGPARAGHADVWHAVLESTQASLEDKEEAIRQLQTLAEGGDRDAGEHIARVRSRSHSMWAKFLAQHLGKDDFSEVTMEEILGHVPNPGIRTDLILELRECLTC